MFARAGGGAGTAGSFGGSPEPDTVFSDEIATGTASRLVTSSFAWMRGICMTRFLGSVLGSSCGKISLSIAARTAPTAAGSTNTNVDVHCTASALLCIAPGPIS